MKRKEFIEQVEKLGLKVEVNEGYGKVLSIKKDGRLMSDIYEDATYSLDTGKSSFDDLHDEIRKQLFTLATEYAATPLEEREEEKRYGIVKISDSGNKFFLERWSTDGRSYFNIFGEITWTTTSFEKAQALALLVDGEVEQL